MTSPAYRRVGLTQFLLASLFVLWLVLLPGLAGSFAWPLGSRLSSMFLGTCFAIRAFEGFQMWRQPAWTRLRWMSWGTLAFLLVIFVATYWHADQINWKTLNPMAFVWVIAYTAEPLVIPFVEPRGAQADDEPATRRLSPGLQMSLILVMFVAAVLFGLFFINPAKFITNYWPWPLTPFDARVGSAFFAGILFWSARMKLLDDWSSVRMGMQALLLFFGGHFIVWLYNLASGAFDPARMPSAWAWGLVLAALTGMLLLFYRGHESKAASLNKAEAAA